MRVFLDTNVLVAALATRGLCADVVRLVIAQHELLIVPLVMRQLEAVLARKLGVPADRIEAMLDFLRDYVVDVDTAEVPAPPVRDRDDAEIARAAIARGAEVIVSGDRDLLDAELPIAVLSPRGFWEMLRQRATALEEVHER